MGTIVNPTITKAPRGAVIKINPNNGIEYIEWLPLTREQEDALTRRNNPKNWKKIQLRTS